MKQKFFADVHGAAEKLWTDIGSNNIKLYDVGDYKTTAQIEVHPQTLTEKWTHVSVATSGDASTGRDWMMIAPYRLDISNDKQSQVFDIDPVLFVLESTSGTPHPSGVVVYHQDFPGRSTPANATNLTPLADAVTNLRTKIVGGSRPLSDAPPEVLEALHHMVNKFRSDFLGSS